MTRGIRDRTAIVGMAQTKFGKGLEDSELSLACQAIAGAIESWDADARVAVVASGGLSHFVVDEELDHMVLKALAERDAETLMSLPRNRLYSAASETQNWVALGGVLHDTPLEMELVEYVAVYRTPAGTGGGWAFARWE